MNGTSAPLENSVQHEINDELIKIQFKMINRDGFSLDVNPSMSVIKLKEEIQKITGLEPDSQRLIYTGKVLKNDKCLSEYNIGNGHAIHVVHRRNEQLPATTPAPATPVASSAPILRNLGNGVLMGEVTLQADGDNVNNVDLSNLLQSIANTLTSPQVSEADNLSTTASAGSDSSYSNLDHPVNNPISNPTQVYEERYASTIRSNLFDVSATIPASMGNSAAGNMANRIQSLTDIFSLSQQHLQRISAMLYNESLLSGDDRQRLRTYINQIAPILIQIGNMSNQIATSMLQLDVGNSPGETLIPIRTTSSTPSRVRNQTNATNAGRTARVAAIPMSGVIGSVLQMVATLSGSSGTSNNSTAGSPTTTSSSQDATNPESATETAEEGGENTDPMVEEND